MSRFTELGTNKTTILMKLINNEDIVKCLVNNQPNFLDVPLPVNFDVTSLIYNSIYPYKFIPQIQTSPSTFITMSFYYKPNGMTYKNGSIYYYIITHNSLIQTSYSSLRYDMLVNYIDEMMNSSRDIGIGKLPFYDMGDIQVNENYCGAYLGYKTTEFQ